MKPTNKSKKLKIEPQIINWQGEEGNLISFVISQNAKRRDLTSGQRAAIAVEIERYFAKEAEIRQKAGVRLMKTLGNFLPRVQKVALHNKLLSH